MFICRNLKDTSIMKYFLLFFVMLLGLMASGESKSWRQKSKHFTDDYPDEYDYLSIEMDKQKDYKDNIIDITDPSWLKFWGGLINPSRAVCPPGLKKDTRGNCRRIWDEDW